MTKKHTYLDSISNAFQAVRAWQAATLSLGVVCILLSGGLIYTVRNAPTILVPYDFAANGGKQSVQTNGSIRGTSHEYLVNTALSDISLITTFTPSTVETQYERFLNRTTESLYANQQLALRAEAKTLKKNATTQSFFPNERTRVAPDGTRVEASGTLIRWIGDREVVRQTMTYVVDYTVFKGYLHIANVNTAESLKAAAKEAQQNDAK